MVRSPAYATERGRQSRVRILDRAIELFAVHGFDAMTMRLLGEAVELDNSSLYRHFPSKAALIDAVLDRVAADVFVVVAPTLDPAHAFSLQALEDACAAIGLHLFDHPAQARLIVHWIMSTGAPSAGFKVAVPATDTTRPGGKLIALLRKQLGDAVARGQLRELGAPEALVILIGIVVVRPATYGYLLKSLEPRRRSSVARAAWEQELRAAVRGAFAP